MKANRFTSVFKSGIVLQNPVFIQYLGLCPMLAVTTTVSNAIGLGLVTTGVLICSNIAISLFGKFVPQKIRVATLMVITAGIVSFMDMLLQAYFPELSVSLGIFVPLIVVNSILFANTDRFISFKSLFASIADGVSRGLGYTTALLFVAIIREIFGKGTIFGIKLFGGGVPLVALALPAGGFLVLGFVTALVQHFKENDLRGAWDE